MPARIVMVEGNKLWIRVKEEPAEEQPARGSRHSSRESRPATRHLSRTREEAPVDSPIEQDPHPLVFEMAPQAAGGTEHQFDTITQGDKTLEEYFKEFILLKTATKCTQNPDAVLLRFWKGLQTEFHVALSGSTYHTAARLADDAARLEKMGRDRKPGKEQGMFRDLGDPVPVPPTAAAHTDQRNPRPA
ncbi:hypothetical protein AALP_AA6G157400 [Arabis alpina]|uniref:Retrotransposon gag domain-containing protein n=1 Tax=Arabis alpina TaxID=50452 RepID=A0A087GPH7_ARAAL|nr:hypothetical protein AALP_AA6G157400 [Arabis alpina]